MGSVRRRVLEADGVGQPLPPFEAITGVSTGALQALFVAAAQAGDTKAYDELTAAYSPTDERQIVSRHKFILAAVYGSVAGLKPLRARVENGICADLAKPCMLDVLKQSTVPVYLGFVEADSGKFTIVNAVKIAQQASRPHGRECIAGAALASAGMPVFLQQVKIEDRTYYDGGVRESVFLARIAATAKQTLARHEKLLLDRHIVPRTAPATPQAEYVIVAASLGSFVVLDALVDGNHPAVEAVVKRTADIYFLANQFALLEVARVEGLDKVAADAAATPASVSQAVGIPVDLRAASARPLAAVTGGLSPISALSQWAATPLPLDLRTRQVPREKQVIAFSDASDILTFRMPPLEGAKVVNVYDRASFNFLGIFENPIEAHTGHVKRNAVWKVLMRR